MRRTDLMTTCKRHVNWTIRDFPTRKRRKIAAIAKLRGITQKEMLESIIDDWLNRYAKNI